MSNDKTKYDANFTAGGLLHHEFLVLKDIILSDNYQDLIADEIENNKILGIPMLSARKRILSEVKRRMTYAPKGFWESFYNWSNEEQPLALFFLCLKTYPIILDIHLEVAVKKFKMGSELDAYDITMRFDEIASINEKVSSWSPLTMSKLNSQYRTALRDAGLYKNMMVQKPSVDSANFWNYFHQVSESWFVEACFVKS